MPQNYPHKISHPSGWPRLSDLPKEEQGAFDKELYGQTCPMVEGEDIQDFFYPWDYVRWKSGHGNNNGNLADFD